MLRTINSVLTIPVYLLYCVHTVLCTLLMCGLIGFTPVSGVTGSIIFYILLVHTAIGVWFIVEQFIFKQKKTYYLKENIPQLVKQISGFLILILMFFHGATFGYVDASGVYIVNTPDISGFMVNFIMTVLFGIHCSKALFDACITLCITTERNKKQVTILCAVLAWLPVIIGLIGCCVYYLPVIFGGAV